VQTKFTFASLGCSHSSYYAGTPWPIMLSQKLNCELKMAYSAGAGNEMNVTKLNQLLVNNKLDLVIVQLTSAGRLTLGLNSESFNFYEPISSDKDLTGTHNVNNVTYYTFNHTSNLENLKRHLNKSYHSDVDDLIINHIITSEYNLYHKIVHTICAMENLARMYGIPIVFFSWCDDIEKIMKENNYATVYNNLNFIPGTAEGFFHEKKIERVKTGPAAGHYDTTAHTSLAFEYILPYLISHNFIQYQASDIV